jgi:hypothetical protein
MEVTNYERDKDSCTTAAEINEDALYSFPSSFDPEILVVFSIY